jgi:hypothetical protein
MVIVKTPSKNAKNKSKIAFWNVEEGETKMIMNFFYKSILKRKEGICILA